MKSLLIQFKIICGGEPPHEVWNACLTLNALPDTVMDAVGLTDKLDDDAPTPTALVAATEHAYVNALANPATVIGLASAVAVWFIPAAVQLAV